MMASRLVMDGGFDVLAAWSVAEICEHLSCASDQDAFTPVALAHPDDPLVMHVGYVRPRSVVTVVPVDDEELAAEFRDREEWIEHG